MPKMIIIECSDEEADRMVEQLKNMIAEYEYHPYHGPGKVYEFGSLRIDQPKQEVTIDGVMVDLTRREFEILGLLAEHPNQALPADFLHNAVWSHPDADHGEEEVAAYLAGHSMDEIATFLNDQEAKYSRKEMTRWYRTSIRYILSNEKYIGDSLLQKTFTPNELPLVNIRNRGQLSQFYVKDSHPAIIPLEMFEAVQRLMKRRAATHTAKPKPGGFPLSHMMKCGFCGSTFQRHLKKEGARWCCYQHRKDKSLCVMEVVAESEVYQTFLLMYNKLLDNKNLILRVMLAQLIELQSKTTFARPEIVDLNQKISDLARQNHSLSRLQAKGCIDSAIFIERSNRNNKLIEELRFELRQLQEPDRVSETIDQTNLLLDLLVDAQPMLEFEPSIFKSMIKEITVYPEKFSFVLSNGLVLCEMRR